MMNRTAAAAFSVKCDIAMLNGRVRLGMARKSRTPEHGREERTDQADANEPERAVHQVRETVGLGPSRGCRRSTTIQTPQSAPGRRRDGTGGPRDQPTRRTSYRSVLPRMRFSATAHSGIIRDRASGSPTGQDFGVSLWSAGDQRDSVWRGKRVRPRRPGMGRPSAPHRGVGRRFAAHPRSLSSQRLVGSWRRSARSQQAAAVTTRLTVGTLVLSNDFRHPTLVAHEAASSTTCPR